MKIFSLIIALSLIVGVIPASAQSDTTKKKGLLYNVSGIGFGLPIGQTGEALKAKFSTNLGFVFRLNKGGLFLYTAADFLSFNYSELYLSSPLAHKIEKGNSTFYVLNIAPGYRKEINKLGIYGYLGPGVGLISEPRVTVNGNVAAISNKSHFSASARTGVGFDYTIGDFMLFVEGGYLHNFQKIQNNQVDVIPVFVGLKSDMSGLLKIFRKK